MDEREKLRDYLKSHSSKMMGEYVLTLDVVEQIIIKDRQRVVEPLLDILNHTGKRIGMIAAMEESVKRAGISK
jgi:hypothetical protein